MSGKSNGLRPLSPHLQVWRWHVTMAASIMTRATGIILYLGLLGITAWLMSLILGQESYKAVMDFLKTPFGKLGIVVLVFSVFYHMAAGLRHLFWDVGLGFRPKTASLTAWLTMAVAAVATLVTWLLAGFLAAAPPHGL